MEKILCFAFTLLLVVISVKSQYCGKLNNVSEVSRSRYYGRSWLLSTRNDRWGWGHQTHRAVISLYLNNRTEFSAGDLEDDLMVKELELQLAVALLGSHRKKLTAGQLALYVNGISATCGNPMNFFGIDLTKRLRHFQYTNSEFEYALVSLSLCHARKRLSKKRILHLLNQLRSTTDFNFWADTQAVAVMALSCLRKNEAYAFVQGDIYQALKGFKKLQLRDGSFGNLYTTGLIVQALLAAEDDGVGWDFLQTLNYLISKQESDGSFGDILATYFILPILYSQNCTEPTMLNDTVKENFTQLKEPEVNDLKWFKEIEVRYSLWIGDNKEENYSVKVNTSSDTKFLDVMKYSANYNPVYQFELDETSWGPFVYKIAGMANDPVGQRYWILYIENQVTHELQFSEYGVGKLCLQNEDHVVFWYKTVVNVI